MRFCWPAQLAGPAQPGFSRNVPQWQARPAGANRRHPALVGAARGHAGYHALAPLLTLGGGEVLGKNAVVTGTKKVAVNTTIATSVYKKREIIDKYNQLTSTLKGDYGLLLRAYDDGVAYRFFTQRPRRLTIVGEEATFNFAQNYPALIPFVRDLRVPTDMYMSSFESLYSARKLAAISRRPW